MSDDELPAAGPDERAFLVGIEARPGDEAPHKVFADWLDEHDRPEEADWHRAWTPEKAAEAQRWFERFAANYTTGYGADERAFTADEVVEAGLASLDGGRRRLTQHGGTDLQESMYDESERLEFLANLAMVTGRYVNVDSEQLSYQPFSCSC